MGLLHERWAIKKLETIGVNMPERIDITVFWAPGCDNMSFISFFHSDIEDMIQEYWQGRQLLMFSVIPLHLIREWIWDQYCREPEEIIIDCIKY
jgi:hypothetical protein